MNPEILKNLKHNMTINILDGGFFGLGIGFASFVTVLPLFVNTMTDSPLLIGLIPALHSAGWQLPQLFISGLVARQKRHKPMVLALTTQERLPFLGLAALAWLRHGIGTQLLLALTFLLIIWQSLGAGFTANAWQSMIAKIIPSERRGSFFGLQSAAANLFASLSAIAAGLILERLADPANFSLVFGLCFVSMVISWLLLAQNREPETALPEGLAPPGNFWSNLGAILKRDHNFRWFLVARMMTQLGLMGFAFYTVFVVNHFGVSKAEAGVMTGLLLGTQIFANPVMGWLCDRWSHRRVMELGLAAAVMSVLIAWRSPSSGWFYLAFFLIGIANVANWTIGIIMSLEFGAEAERPTYIGLANTLVAPAVILAPTLGGWVAEVRGYPPVFLASAIAGVATLLVLHNLVKDPRRTPAA